MKKSILFTLLLAVAVFGVATYVIGYSGPAPEVVVEGDMYMTEAPDKLGAVAGPDVYDQMYFYGGAMFGGATTTITATTSAGDLTLTAAQVCDNNYIELGGAINAGAFTLTMPSANALYGDCLRGDGMTKSILVGNSSGNNATVTAGTGGVLLEGDSLNVVIADGNFVKIELMQGDVSGGMYFIMSTEYQDGD